MRINHFIDKEHFLHLAEQHNVVPIWAELLADTETPVTLLKKIYPNQGPIFLLESVEGGERWGRYSFLSASARTQVNVFRQTVEITENGINQQIDHNGDPLQVLRSLLGRYHPPYISELPRFWGGMVGYMSYEMVTFFENIPNRLPENRPIAHFMIPDELLVFDNIRHTLQVIVMAFPEKNTDLNACYQDAAHRLDQLIQKVETDSVPKQASRTADFKLVNRLEPEAYRSMVATVKDYIRAGDIIQSVVSQPFVCEPAPDLWSLYRAQRFINPSPYMFFIHLGAIALVGSSPESMVRLENGIASLRPIAGTRPRGASEQEDRMFANELLQDEKEKAEHLMLVDLGRNDLGRVAETGSVQVTDLMIVERYSHVMHLVSNISCDLKTQYDAWDLIRATFPAGTLSGAPKVRAMEIIDEMEQEARGPYGGAVGYVSFHGNMDLAITIRTACVTDDTMMVRAGAGIVADSDPERERLETINKAKAIENALRLISSQS